MTALRYKVHNSPQYRVAPLRPRGMASTVAANSARLRGTVSIPFRTGALSPLPHPIRRCPHCRQSRGPPPAPSSHCATTQPKPPSPKRKTTASDSRNSDRSRLSLTASADHQESVYPNHARRTPPQRPHPVPPEVRSLANPTAFSSQVNVTPDPSPFRDVAQTPPRVPQIETAVRNSQPASSLAQPVATTLAATSITASNVRIPRNIAALCPLCRCSNSP